MLVTDWIRRLKNDLRTANLTLGSSTWILSNQQNNINSFSVTDLSTAFSCIVVMSVVPRFFACILGPPSLRVLEKLLKEGSRTIGIIIGRERYFEEKTPSGN